jgi:hypothetical protein
LHPCIVVLHLKGVAPAADTKAVEHPAPDSTLEVDTSEPVLELLPALDVADAPDEEEEEPDNAVLSENDRLQSSDPLKLYVRQIGDGRLLTPS